MLDSKASDLDKEERPEVNFSSFLLFASVDANALFLKKLYINIFICYLFIYLFDQCSLFFLLLLGKKKE